MNDKQRARAIELAKSVNEALIRLIRRVSQAADDAYNVKYPDVLANALERVQTKLYLLRLNRRLTVEEEAQAHLRLLADETDRLDEQFPGFS